VRQVQYQGAGADGQLPDLSELRVFEVWVSAPNSKLSVYVNV
jgi:hypothetical protein